MSGGESKEEKRTGDDKIWWRWSVKEMILRYWNDPPISVIYDPNDAYIERQMEDDEVVRRYLELDDEARRYIEEKKLYNSNNAEICGCSQHADGKTLNGQQPYEHIRWP